MKITDVQACVIGREEPDSGGSVWTFVRIYTDQGIVGTGECNSGGPGFSGFATKAAILAMKPLLIGEDPFNINLIYEKLRRRGRYGGSSHAPLIFALTGIDNALYDIVGKALNVPIYQLLGGKFRDKLRLYADCHAGETSDPQAYADKALEVVAEGYTAVKFDVDHAVEGKLDPYNWTVGAREMNQVIKLIEGLRAALGYATDLAIDCHGQFDLPSAITLAKAVEPLRLLWLEEPVPAENLDALAQVRRSSSTVICTGENQYTRFEFLEMFERKATDVIMPDLAKAGGIAEAKRIADIADAHYIPIAPHNVSSPLGMMAACHVMASVPNFLVLEFHGRMISWWNDLCDGDQPFIEPGFMRVSDRPGIGVELNAKNAKALLWNDDTYFD
ncbi:MAG: mandelate racemase/muconate lactonizing enzyme family protein [Chloroflexi bacterium]|uniref:mandelate racemase/muconate lactonizing enzyme family protein n=1 Tax=Candidatus Flexifilum breve TaxID=3140694 RepID=UPI0031355376|nr:mandelate racemase/muconate lactonizing enzyme family protein [Chloroflexota bacterium]